MKNKKKYINIFVASMLVVCSLFMSVCIYKINDNLSVADEEYELYVNQQNSAYEESIKEMITAETEINTNQNAGTGTTAKVYTDFYELFAHAEDTLEKAPSFKMTIDGGSLGADVTVSGTPLGDMDMFHLNNTMNITQSRSKTGEEVLIYQQYGDTPAIVSGMFNNQFYALIYKDLPVVYELLTKDKSETVGTGSSGKFTQLTEQNFLDTYKNDITDFFYDINESTVKELVYFLPATKASDTATAKIVLNTDAEYNQNNQVKRATEKYSTQINKLCNFLRPAVFSSCEMILNFSYDGKLLSTTVSEKFTVWYKFSSYECPIEVTSNYTSVYSYRDYTINVAV